jgi:hypothetical protein
MRGYRADRIHAVFMLFQQGEQIGSRIVAGHAE